MIATKKLLLGGAATALFPVLMLSSDLSVAGSLSTALEESKVSGQWRTMYMKTNNKESLQDWHALATGGKLKLETGRWNGWSIGIAGYLSHDLNSNKEVVDPVTGRKSRYELAMFDLESPNDNNVSLIGEAYLSWTDKKHTVTAGRMKLNTPFMNAFDGRMIPGLFEGAWYKNNAIKNVPLQFGVINAIAVRGTSEFKDLDEAIGTLGQGKAPDGKNSNYAGNLDTDYVAVLGADYKEVKGLNVQVWDYYWDNVMNTTFLQGVYKIKQDDLTYTLGGQYIRQDIVGDGGNTDQSKSFVEDGFKSNTFGLQTGVAGYGASLTLAANHTTDDGRFTKPREWGKDPLFTFQRRELADGFGDSSSWLVRLKYDLGRVGAQGLSVVVDHGQHNRKSLTGADKFKFNKYAFPSFTQTNVNLIYKMDHLVKGLKTELLYVRKRDQDDTDKAAFQQNKAEMNQLNLIVNYTF
jgi:hypothetical protein